MSNRTSNTTVEPRGSEVENRENVLLLRRQSVPEHELNPQERTKATQKKKKKKPKVRWTEDVVDNEDMNKKKTKICCIFHPQRNFDDGTDSDHSHSDSDSSSDSSGDERGGHEGSSRGPDGGNDSKKIVDGVKKEPIPNAYEYQPVYKNESKLPPGINDER